MSFYSDPLLTSVVLLGSFVLSFPAHGEEMPRLADGRPDLSGTCGVTTATPVVENLLRSARQLEREAAAVASRTGE